MEKGLRRTLAAMVLSKLQEKSFFKSHLMHSPSYPFPAREKLPVVYVALTPSSVRPETSYQVQSDFRFSVVPIIEARDDLDLMKCDAIDEVEEAIQELQVDPAFQAKFSQIDLETVDPGPLSLSVFGFEPLIIEPPIGAVRMDYRVDFYYEGVSP